MHYVSPLSPGSHQASTPFTFTYLRRSRSPVSHRSYYMNHVKIYPFSDVWCPQWALEATSYKCQIHLAARCTMFPHWAPGATRLQHPLHLAGFQGSLGTLHVWKWIDLDVVHVVAPKAHRGPGPSEIGKCKGRWNLVAPGAEWGYIMHRLARCIRHWYEVAPRAHWGQRMPPVNSNWSYSPETLNLVKIGDLLSCVTLKFHWWP